VSPDDCSLALRGLQTLAVRLQQLEESTLAVARWCAEQSEVATVLHPALPTSGQPHLPPAESPGRRRLYLERCTRNEAEILFPAGCMVDTTTGIVYRMEPGKRLVPCGRHEGRFWIYPEDVALCD